MKKFLLIMLGIISYNISIAQVTGFKINNRISSIITSQKDSIKTTDNEKKEVYKTLDIIQYNYLKLTKDSLESLLTDLENNLYNNSTGADGKPTYNPDIIKAKSDSITALKAQIAAIETRQDSLYYQYTKDYLNYRNVSVLNFGALRSRAFFDLIYGGEGNRFKALGNAGLSFGNKSGSLYSEIVSGNLGLFRVSLGAMISNSQNDDDTQEKQEEAYQRLVNFGGNTVLNFEYPLAYVHSYNNQYNFISRFVAKGTADFPAFGTSTEEWAGSGSFGIDFYGDAALSNNQLRFFFNVNANMIYGTDVFKTNLGVDNNNFSFGQVTLGLVFLENFKISFIVSTFSSQESLRNKNVVAGGQVLR